MSKISSRALCPDYIQKKPISYNLLALNLAPIPEHDKLEDTRRRQMRLHRQAAQLKQNFDQIIQDIVGKAADLHSQAGALDTLFSAFPDCRSTILDNYLPQHIMAAVANHIVALAGENKSLGVVGSSHPPAEFIKDNRFGSFDCTVCLSRPTHRLVPCQHTLCFDHLLLAHDVDAHSPSSCVRCDQVCLFHNCVPLLLSPLTYSPPPVCHQNCRID